MDHTKKFRFLDVRKFFENPVKGTPNSFSNSRRTALKQLSTLMIGISPGINTLAKAFNGSFTYRKKGRGVVFYSGGVSVWEILPEEFDGKPQVLLEETDKNIKLELNNAFYPSTAIRADFKAVISHESGGWEMNIRFPAIGASGSLPFNNWLSGNSSIPGFITSDLNYILDSNDRLDIKGPVSLSINNRWQIHMQPEEKVNLKLFNSDEKYEELVISLFRSGSNNNQFFRETDKATLFELSRPEGRLQSMEALRFSGKQIFRNDAYPFSYTRLVMSDSSGIAHKTLWAEGGSEDQSNTGFLMQSNGENILDLFRSRFYKEYNPESSPFIYTADLGGCPQWVGAAGAAFALRGSDDQRFLLTGNGSDVDILNCKALLVGSRIHVSGAQSVPIEYKEPPEVTILQQDPKQVKPKTIKAGEVLNTGAIIEVAPEDDSKATWLYINQEPLRVKFKVDKPIMFNVIRPEDFINLQFEFINFVLENNLLKIDSKKEPSFLIVHFPSQHTREEVMRDIIPLSADKQPEDWNSVKSLHAPVKFMRAGSSRLVYRIPEGYEQFTVSLENLLDWKNFDLQVNYRARWFNQVSAVSMVRSQLQTVTMAYSKKARSTRMELNAPAVSYNARSIKAVDSKKSTITDLQKPKTSLEVKVTLATTPKGSGVMALSDSQFTGLLASPTIDTINTFNLQGQMKRLFIMKEPSKYETMIEAPTYFQISPNQFAGFQHLIDLRDASGQYDPSEAGVVDTSDEAPVMLVPDKSKMTIKEPVKRVPPSLATSSVRQMSNINYLGNVVIGTKPTPLYKGIVSSKLIRMPLAVNLPQGSLIELWHTRMGIKLASGEIDENSLNQLKTVRVIWSEFADSDVAKTKTISDTDKYFYSLPNPKHAHQIVHLTSNYTDLKQEKNRGKYNPRPVKADLLMLSALGSWFDFKLNIPEDVISLSVKAWLQRATMGRDHYIKVVERGNLFPFGHKALLITIAERRIRLINNVNTAFLIQREFIVVKQPEIFYGNQAGTSDFIPFPFQRVELLDAQAEVYSENVSSSINDAKILNMPDGSGKPFFFRIEVDDASGKSVRMEVPLAWVSATLDKADVVINHFNSNNWDYFTSNIPSKPVAYARSLVPGDTTFETAGIIFKARPFESNEPGITFYPEILESSIYIRQLEELTSTRKPVTIRLVDDNNLSMVFAEVTDTDKQALVFGNTENSGGFLSPNMNINGLSKLTGLVGNKIENLDNLVLNIKDCFNMAEKLMPKLFGAISFIELLEPNVNLTSAINGIKSSVEASRSQIEDLEHGLLLTLAAIDNEVKKLDKLIEVIASLLNDTDITGVLQDIPKLSAAFTAYGIQIEGDPVDALNATVLVGKEIQAKGVVLKDISGFVGNAQGFKNKLKDAGINITPEFSSNVDKLLKVVKALNVKSFSDEEIIGIVGGLGLAGKVSDIQGLIKTIASELADKVLQAIPQIPNVKFQIKGNEIVVEYHWKPKTRKSYYVDNYFQHYHS